MNDLLAKFSAKDEILKQRGARDVDSERVLIISKPGRPGANRTLAVLSKMLSMAEVWGYRG